MYVRYGAANRMVPVRGLRNLGDTAQMVVAPGGVYVFSFQSVGFKPMDSTLRARLADVPGVSARKWEWTGGIPIIGLLDDTLSITFAYSGAAKDANQLGSQIVAALSQGLIGSFIYQGADTVSAPSVPTSNAESGTVFQPRASDGLPGNRNNDNGMPGMNIPWGWVFGIGGGAIGLLLLKR
jgi:hypothetical protein